MEATFVNSPGDKTHQPNTSSSINQVYLPLHLNTFRKQRKTLLFTPQNLNIDTTQTKLQTHLSENHIERESELKKLVFRYSKTE